MILDGWHENGNKKEEEGGRNEGGGRGNINISERGRQADKGMSRSLEPIFCKEDRINRCFCELLNHFEGPCVFSRTCWPCCFKLFKQFLF